MYSSQNPEDRVQESAFKILNSNSIYQRLNIRYNLRYQVMDLTYFLVVG
jgi:hypothetical protein